MHNKDGLSAIQAMKKEIKKLDARILQEERQMYIDNTTHEEIIEDLKEKKETFEEAIELMKELYNEV